MFVSFTIRTLEDVVILTSNKGGDIYAAHVT